MADRFNRMTHFRLRHRALLDDQPLFGLLPCEVEELSCLQHLMAMDIAWMIPPTGASDPGPRPRQRTLKEP